MGAKHALKAILTGVVFFLGFQFGQDAATKLMNMTTTSTPATS
jgi:hypothetical protein